MSTRLPALLLILFLSGCGALRPGIPGSGVSRTEYRQVEPFEEVNLSGFGTVNVFAGNVSVGGKPTVRVTTDNNLLSHVDTQVENGQLKIKPRGRIKPKTGLNVDITVPHLTAARVSGAGDLNINDVVGDELDLSISGAGNVNANGYVKNLTTSISGAGDADLRDLYAETASVRISGVGDANVYASESIKARISGAGDVHCYGNPTHVDQKVSGVGDFEIRTDDGPVEYTLGDEQ